MVNYQYDATKEACPLPLVKLRVMLKKMKTGESCRLLLKDTGSKSDIPRLLDKLGHSYTSQVGDDSIQEFIITIR
ncbi:sulfurtransferase TusA family protein [Thalassotalea sp. M1531]|uniref:Sulfurtransferase TusA family protein n=1 Tax=Thalassotalea algicola TaxID=2716224 RepID=A0A7Y0Q6Y6_9GAMM|nr:sulfurtransferase TusA family protein [Thalassotalea algicola]NMP32479.1 sulfurtransferase TusA family protein [Thalassotalea algicola]